MQALPDLCAICKFDPNPPSRCSLIDCRTPQPDCASCKAYPSIPGCAGKTWAPVCLTCYSPAKCDTLGCPFNFVRKQLPCCGSKAAKAAGAVAPPMCSECSSHSSSRSSSRSSSHVSSSSSDGGPSQSQGSSTERPTAADIVSAARNAAERLEEELQELQRRAAHRKLL